MSAAAPLPRNAVLCGERNELHVRTAPPVSHDVRRPARPGKERRLNASTGKPRSSLEPRHRRLKYITTCVRARLLRRSDDVSSHGSICCCRNRASSTARGLVSFAAMRRRLRRIYSSSAAISSAPRAQTTNYLRVGVFE
jgi:hypothetical protein